MRKCHHCETELPPETDHYVITGDEYCTACVEARPFTCYSFYIDGEYMGSSVEDSSDRLIEAYEDEYEGDEEA